MLWVFFWEIDYLGFCCICAEGCFPLEDVLSAEVPAGPAAATWPHLSLYGAATTHKAVCALITPGYI